jgi:hypothetical protein
MNERPITVKIRTEDAIRFFETKAALAKALQINPQAITTWGEFVPELRAFQLREISPETFSNQAADTAQEAA